ncbi:SusC/RagA family TonB-linked outer membrane protein [Spirosoma sp. HMF3257]|uniref:SusC/RagA family TonB-linked outer membrane protein n=1 Tax=Spirosoma telluris TaxID=2183553 RepID=A0A327NF89_9BACT|nr:SusC/RagA family TonB-linked outer membrane protein [Spirosoma telluris]RAI73443.1 SusC/RagA family TonB-linked outer membrane protein [Spirosoma telluris]
MRISFSQLLLSLFFFGVSSAHDGYAQELLNKRISLKVENQSIKKVLNEIEKSAEIRFIYSSNLIKSERKISLNLDNSTLGEALENLLTPLQLGYKVLGKQIVLNRVEPKAGLILKDVPDVTVVSPLDIPIKGTVTSESGEQLPGVSIVIKGTQRGTTTDQNGAFKIDVQDGKAVLIFSFIGYVRQEVVVGNQTAVNVSLKADDLSLNEVVVVGYGEQKKSDLTGAVSSIQPKDIVRANPVLASKALQGQVAGATVTKSDNRPGSTYNITIRGENTINNSTAPLVVIDGLMGGDINNLNPNDIQSMDVLKDASSTAIYGARGANGVIIITTKKGISGKPRVSYDAYVGIKTPAHVPRLRTSEEFYKLTYTDRILEGVTGNTFTAAELDNIKNGRTTDWVALVTKPGIQTSQNISVSGGTEKTTYRFSGGFLNEDGNVVSTNYKRYNLNAGLDSKLGDHFKVGFTSYVTYSNQNLGSQESLRGAFRARPTGVPYYADIANPSENQDVNVNGLAVWMGINDKQVPNPLLDTDPKQSKLQTTVANIMGNAYVEYSPIKGLSIRSALSATYGSTRLGDFRGTWSKSQIGAKPRAQVDNRTLGSYTLDNIITYNMDLGKHKLNFTGLQSAFYQRNETYTIAAKDLPFDSDWYALNTGTVTTYASSLVERSLSSFMGRINYSFNDKYLLTVTGRSDGASQLAPGNKWAFFPSVAVAWKLIDEPLIQNIKAISNLKLRLSYGQVGNSTVNPYSTQAGLLNTGYDFDGTAAYGFAPANLGNKDLRWERSKEINVGVDFGLFNNRVSGTVEVYDRKTEDLILSQKIPTASGFSQVTSNIGKIQNKGIEILLNTVNIASNNFSWNSTFTFTKNNNKLLELYGDGQTVDKGNKLFVGLPIKANFDYQFNGIWQTADKDLAATYKQVPGSVRVTDVNNDGQISSTEGIDDRVYLGTQLPNFLIGMTNRFKYKNFDFSFFTYYRNGTQYKNNTLAGTFGDIGTRYNSLASLDYWRSDNPSNTYFGAVAANPYRVAIQYQDASFLRISDITLGFTVPKGLMSKWKLNTARVYAQVINPVIKSKFTGFDPEFNSSIYQDDLPSMTLSLGVNLSF